jgi:hypothetical protein
MRFLPQKKGEGLLFLFCFYLRLLRMRAMAATIAMMMTAAIAT